MATTIKIRNSSTPGATPASLKQGEFAINVADGRLFYGSGSVDVVKEFTGVGIDTGSFATTGSNTFVGNQYIVGDITASGDISASGKFSGGIGSFIYNTDLSGAGSFSGNIIKTGATATIAGGLYYMDTSGGWVGANASSISTSTSLLAMAVGTNSTTNGMILNGVVVYAIDPGGDPGDALYIDTTTFRIIATAPTVAGNVVRKVGHKLSGTRIYFNPSLDHVVIS